MLFLCVYIHYIRNNNILPGYNNYMNTTQRPTLIFISILFGCFGASLLATSISTALVTIMRDFSLSSSMGQWLTTGYGLAMGITIPLSAYLMNRFSTRWLYLIGLLMVILGLVACIFASNFLLMMSGRILQAMGNGFLNTISQAILILLYTDQKRGLMLGYYGLALGAAPAIAPTLAGFLTDMLGWQMIFIIPAIIMSVSLILALFSMNDIIPNSKISLDIPSLILSSLFFGSIIFGLVHRALFYWLIGITTGISFIQRQLHLSNPFLAVQLFMHRNFTISVILSTLTYLIMMGGTLAVPTYAQKILGYSATIAGLISLPGSLSLAILSPISGKIYDRYGISPLMIGGCVLQAVGSLGFYLMYHRCGLLFLILFHTIRCIGIGCLMMPLVTWGVTALKISSTDTPKQPSSVSESSAATNGTTLIQSLRTLGSAIGSALFMYLIPK